MSVLANPEYRALKVREAELAAEIERLTDEGLALADKDRITPGEQQRLDNLTAGVEKRTTERNEIRNQIRSMLEGAVAAGTARQQTGDGANDFQVMRRVDTDLDLGASAPEARDAALAAADRVSQARSAIDGGEVRSDLRPLFERSPQFADVFRATANEHYLTAFVKLLGAGDPGDAALMMTDDERAAMQRVRQAEQRAAAISPVTAGGYAVPQILDPSVMLTNGGVVNPIRQIARKVTGIGNVWSGISSAGITAAWYAEGEEVTDDAPALTQPEITAHRASAFVPYSIEIEQDWASMATEMIRLLSDAKDRLEGAAFVNGDGSGKPRGLVHRLTASTASGVKLDVTTAGTFDAVDVRKLFADLPARFRPNASWMSSISVANHVRSLGDDKLGNQTVNLSAGYTFPVLGRPWYEASDMPEMVSSTGTEPLVVVGDFSNYIIFDRVASARVELVPHLFGTTNGRPTAERGIFYHWRVGADTYTASNALEPGFRVLVNKT